VKNTENVFQFTLLRMFVSSQSKEEKNIQVMILLKNKRACLIREKNIYFVETDDTIEQFVRETMFKFV
jgi:hypothetical protein